MFECSFCGKLQDEVNTLITGRNANICDKCVLICIKIIIENCSKKQTENYELKEALHLMETL